MLRSDSTALFERLREANILLQEVLSGAQENMNSIEHTMATRVSEFVAAMNDLSSKSGATTAKVEQHLGTFNTVTAKVLRDLGDLADQFSSHGRTLADAVELLEASNRRTDDSIAGRHATIETLVSTLDTRTEDFGQRLQRFSSLLEESLDTATARAREIAGIIAETSNESVQTIEQQYDLVRKTSDEERQRTSEALNAVYDEASAEVQAMFNQSAGRFTEIMEGMKQMAGGNAARARNHAGRVAPRHSRIAAGDRRERGADAARHRRPDRGARRAQSHRRPARPVARRRGTVAARGRAALRRKRRTRTTAADAGRYCRSAAAASADARHHRRPDAATQCAHAEPGAGRQGRQQCPWRRLALRSVDPRIARRRPADRAAAPRAKPPRGEERPQRDSVDSIDSLSVDIARMIDNDAAAELWERYKRGERGVFTRRLYTASGPEGVR